MKTVILAGGFGKRLRPLTDTRPKPMIKILNIPIIEWQIRWLRSFGLKDFVLCVGYMKETIVDHIGNGLRFDSRIQYSFEEKALGTGGALLNAKEFVSGEDSFFVLNGDVLTELDPNKLLSITNSNVLAVVPLRSPFGVVELDENSHVRGFIEKPEISGKWINAGLYLFTSEVFRYLPAEGNVEVTALPILAKEGRLQAVRYKDVFWRSIDSHKDIEEASKEIKEAKLL
ncbi:MAG: nucleotidyltransferase family protein [Thermoproteota archaeon]|nr:nucleotidyltransferase family protein [Thermoproteota archaeon]